MKKNKICWQKYEDVIEKQLSSPMINTILKNIARNRAIEDLEDIEDDLEDEDDEENIDSYEDDVPYETNNIPQILPVSTKLLEELMVLSNFDCWMGHTNFDITPKIKEQLDAIQGIEVLKICSRYRFFIGIGSMFQFKDVRKVIEKELLKGWTTMDINTKIEEALKNKDIVNIIK